MRFTCLGLLLALLLVSAGCGSGFHSVRGKVVYPDGTPLPEGWISFEKTEGENTHSADSPIDANGAFELRTARPGDGVPPGKYKVMIKGKEWTLAEGRKRVYHLDPKFESFETSGIELVVEPKTNFFEIKVTKPK